MEPDHLALRVQRVWGLAIPNLFWRSVEVVSAPPPLYLNFKLAMIAKPSVERVADTYRNFYLLYSSR